MRSRSTAIVAALAAGVTFLGTVAAVAGDSRTTRIETRPFYGATVTIEEGVRVFRPLPPHDRVIINPGGRANVNLSFEETRATTHNYNHDRSGGGSPTSSGGDGSVPYVVGAPVVGAPHATGGGVPVRAPARGHGHHGGRH